MRLVQNIILAIRKRLLQRRQKRQRRNKKSPPIITSQNYRRGFSFKQTISRVLLWMVIYLVSLLPARSNGLPRGTNEAEPLHPSLFSLSPSGVCHASDVAIRAVGSYIKSIRVSLFLTRGNDPAISPLFHQKYGTVYFLLHFPSRHRDSALRSAVSCGARTFLPSLPFIRTVRTDDHLVYLIFS